MPNAASKPAKAPPVKAAAPPPTEQDESGDESTGDGEEGFMSDEYYDSDDAEGESDGGKLR